MSHKVKLILKVSTIVFLFIIGILFVILYQLFSNKEATHALELTEISKITNLNFSENVKVIGTRYECGLDEDLYLALEMPYDELKELFPEGKCHPSTTIRHATNTVGLEWFCPDSISNFKSFQYSDEVNHAYIDVLYEDNDAPVRKVFIIWFTT